MIRGSHRVTPERSAASFGIHNRFDIEVIDAKSGQLKQQAKAYNVICNQLWTKLCSLTAYFSYIHYGSGDGTPSVSDTSLFNYVGGQQADSLSVSFDYANGVFSARKQIQLSASTAVGVNITEVGIASASAASNLCTHAMLEDMNGNRISIEKTDTDVLNIYATIYIHFNSEGYDNGYIRPTVHMPVNSIFASLCGISAYKPNQMYITPFDTFGISKRTSLGVAPCYKGGMEGNVGVSVKGDAAAKTITFTPSRLEANAHNRGGFRYLNLWNYTHISNGHIYEPWCIIRPGGSWFPCSNITAESVGTGDGSTVDYSLAFPFVSNVRVYLDGVETTDFITDYAPNTVEDFTYYMRVLHPSSTVDNHIDSFNGSNDGTTSNTLLVYNPVYAIGVGSVKCNQSASVYASDDLSTWDLVASASEETYVKTVTHNVPAEYANRKYWRFEEVSSSYLSSAALVPPSSFTGKTLHFTTPPPVGAVITADYKTDTIAKDENHVFDLSITIHLNEYNEG